jgi:hypothetical protein
MAVAKPFPEKEQSCSGRLSSCLKLEQQYIQDLFSSDKCWQLKYTTTSTLLNKSSGKYVVVKGSGQLMAKSNFRYMKVDRIELFADQNETYTINNSNKTILRTNTSKEIMQLGGKFFAGIMADSIHKNYTLKSCKSVFDSVRKMNLIEYELVVNKGVKNAISYIVYSFDERSNAIKKIYVRYNPELVSDVKDNLVVIDYRGEGKLDKSWFPIRNVVMTAEGKLKKEYTYYRYKDLINVKR